MDGRDPPTPPSNPEPASRHGRLSRAGFNLLGWIFVCVGFVGVVTPVLPTTIFLLIALACFARGSPRFHDWLYHHPKLGPPLQAWRRHGVIRPRAKATAIAMLAVSLVATAILSGTPWAPILLAPLLAAVALFILTRPGSAPKGE
ncbi:YbaN family protein [Inquilinus sp. CAU 1745]|uniref:YbaN family protein n=1 Tax=Inquilinus sp. CAU 1745 TaxID=3140369 RepID=UPI00325B7589